MNIFQILRTVILWLVTFKLVTLCFTLMSKANDLYLLSGIVGLVLLIWVVFKTKFLTNFKFKKPNQ